MITLTAPPSSRCRARVPGPPTAAGRPDPAPLARRPYGRVLVSAPATRKLSWWLISTSTSAATGWNRSVPADPAARHLLRSARWSSGAVTTTAVVTAGTVARGPGPARSPMRSWWSTVPSVRWAARARGPRPESTASRSTSKAASSCRPSATATHPLYGGLERSVRGAAVAVSVERILAAVRSTPHTPREWIVGASYDGSPGARRPIRRPLAGLRGRRPPGGAAGLGLPHHVGQHRGARARRHHPDTPDPVLGEDSAPSGRLGARHVTRMGRNRSGDGRDAAP